MGGEEPGPELLCIGNALVDVYVREEDAPGLCSGLTKPVEHIGADRMGELLAALSGAGFTACSGGGAANAAKIAGLLGVRAGFIGVVGEAEGRPDRFGRLFRDDLAGAGVLPLLRLAEKPTGVFLLVEMAGGERRIAAAPSAALELREEDIRAEDLRSARVVVVDGYILDRRELVGHILNLADHWGTVAALDLGSPALAESRAGDIAAYIRKYQMILFMNEEEAGAFYRALNREPCPAPPPGRDKEALRESAGEAGRAGGELHREMERFFKGLTAGGFFPIIVVKLGKRGSMVCAGGELYREGTLQAVPLDPTGAGDAYCAAFLAAWLRDKPLHTCAGFGNKVARETLEVPGTKIDRERLRRFAGMLGVCRASPEKPPESGATKAAPPGAASPPPPR
jgi:sugar/nucleoside kinase (ribokinase family)